MRYFGTIDSDDFDLTFKPFILRENEISFFAEGQDGWGKFTIEGIAHKNKEGKYISQSLPLTYAMHGPIGTVFDIIFSVVDADEKECHMDLTWKQEGETWEASGTLKAQ